MNVGILGGSFSPITLGHIDLAKLVVRYTNINRVWFTPCYKHRFDKVMLQPETRVKMCELVCEDFENFHTSEYEIQRKLTGSTYEFMLQLLKTYDRTNMKFSLIIGMDNANDIESWHNYKNLIEMVSFIVFPRMGIPEDSNIDWYKKRPHIYLHECQPIKISSTKVRDYIQSGEYDIADKYLHPAVFKFIKQKNLYTLKEVG